MTAARAIVPGATYLITRRCVLRRFYLRPGRETNHVVRYCLARAAKRTGVVVHAVCWMSNHGHLVVTDVEGRLPEFCEWLFRTIAQCVKGVHGIRENVWGDGSYSAVRLETEEAIVDKLAYVMANPVTAGLVREARQWPGVVSRPSDMYGAEHGGERPSEWFHESQEESARITLCAPPCFEGRVDELVAAVRSMVAEREKLAAEELRRTGRRVLGAGRALDVDPFDAPSTDEAERVRNPVFAAVTDEARRAAVRTLRDWRRAYAAAWARWRAGDHAAVFPYGTWWMRVFASAAVVTGPPA